MKMILALAIFCIHINPSLCQSWRLQSLSKIDIDSALEVIAQNKRHNGRERESAYNDLILAYCEMEDKKKEDVFLALYENRNIDLQKFHRFLQTNKCIVAGKSMRNIIDQTEAAVPGEFSPEMIIALRLNHYLEIEPYHDLELAKNRWRLQLSQSLSQRSGITEFEAFWPLLVRVNLGDTVAQQFLIDEMSGLLNGMTRGEKVIKGNEKDVEWLYAALITYVLQWTNVKKIVQEVSPCFLNLEHWYESTDYGLVSVRRRYLASVLETKIDWNHQKEFYYRYISPYDFDKNQIEIDKVMDELIMAIKNNELKWIPRMID